MQSSQENKEVFTLSIIDREGILVHMVTRVEICSPTGIFTIGYGHAPLISFLKHGSHVSYQGESNHSGSFKVLKGIFIVQDNHAKIINFHPALEESEE